MKFEKSNPAYANAWHALDQNASAAGLCFHVNGLHLRPEVFQRRTDGTVVAAQYAGNGSIIWFVGDENVPTTPEGAEHLAQWVATSRERLDALCDHICTIDETLVGLDRKRAAELEAAHQKAGGTKK